MEKEKFLSLIEKYLNDVATVEEKNLVEAYYHRMGEKKYRMLSHQEEEIFKASLMRRIEAELWPEQTLKSYKPGRGNLHISIKWVAVAAVLAVIITALLLFKSNKIRTAVPVDYASRILPGGDRAVLILGNGSKIDLATAGQGYIAAQPGQEIKKTGDGKLIYNRLTSDTFPEKLKANFNTVIVPNGGKFQVVLSDGTKVWLNSASSIRYPSTFSKENRIVELSGEGYFEVSHDRSRPFIVKTKKQEVEVLGTHFNISAYDDDGTTTTTLLEGSVAINPFFSSGSLSRHYIHLVPGQQSQLKGSLIQVDNVDTEVAIDWKNGKFIFKNENIKSIMRKLSRWYDIEVAYEGNVENLHFGGKVSRSKNLKEALRILTLTGDINIKVEGRRVTVML